NNIWPHVQKQASNSRQAQRKSNRHACTQQQTQTNNKSNSRNSWCHDGSPDNLIISATYCRVSSANPSNIGVSGIQRGTAATLGVVHPPSNASYKCIPVAMDMTKQKIMPHHAPTLSIQLRV